MPSSVKFGIAAENFLDARVLFGRQAVFGGELRRDFDFGSRRAWTACVRRAPLG